MNVPTPGATRSYKRLNHKQLTVRLTNLRKLVKYLLFILCLTTGLFYIKSCLLLSCHCITASLGLSHIFTKHKEMNIVTKCSLPLMQSRMCRLNKCADHRTVPLFGLFPNYVKTIQAMSKLPRTTIRLVYSNALSKVLK